MSRKNRCVHMGVDGLHMTTITRMKTGRCRPRLQFFANWSVSMGFVLDALIQCLPEPGGLSLTLCEHIPSYSQLRRDTFDKGGILIHAVSHRHRVYPCIATGDTGLMKRAGLKYGDTLLMQYEYGFIRMRKLPDGAAKIVTSRIYGQWLEELGFTPGAVLTVDSDPGIITCQLQENGITRTHELVKYARQNKLHLIQVTPMRDNNYLPQFEIPLSRLKMANLCCGEAFIAYYEYGRITLQRIDFEALGF